MKFIPVKDSGLEFTAAGAPTPRIKDRDTGELRKDSEGRTLYQVTVLAGQSGGDGELIKITVAGKPEGIRRGVPITVTGLIAIPWAQLRNGVLYSGVAYRAESITVDTAEVAA